MENSMAEFFLNKYSKIIVQEFPGTSEFGISFLSGVENYVESLEPIDLKYNASYSFNSIDDAIRVTFTSFYDYDERLIDNPIFSEINRCMMKLRDGRVVKLLKVITPLLQGATYDFIVAPTEYIKEIMYTVKSVKDYKINTSIHAPLIDLPLEEIKRDVLDFLDNEEFSKFCEKYNIKKKRGIIFTGEPGVGKTLLLSWLKFQAIQRKIEFVAYKSPKEYLDSDIDYNDNTKKIIVFEEFDTYMQEREQGDENNKRIESNQIMGSLLQLLDGIEEVSNVVFIFTTNHVRTFDSAIIRPGRIDKVMKFNLPTKESQERFLDAYVPDYSDDTKSHIIEFLSNKSVTVSYAMLKSIVDNIRITEFWKAQNNDTNVKCSFKEISDIISTVISSANKGKKTKQVSEEVL